MKPENRLAVAVGLDVFVVVLFVALGLRTHEEESAYAAILVTAAPFLIGLGLAWLVARAWRRPTAILTGLMIWPVTVLLGMLLRSGLFDRGTAASWSGRSGGCCRIGRLVAAYSAIAGSPEP